MNMQGAYGGGKAGASFDPLLFVQRPTVVLRGVCWLFAIIVFGCISSQGWIVDPATSKDVCQMGDDSGVCTFSVGVGVIGFLASMGFLAGEYLFEQMSSVKTRKHYVLGDLGFSGFWAFLFFIDFCYLCSAWGKTTEQPNGYGVNNIRAAIFFAFLSVFGWAGCAFFAFQRFKAGVDPTFSSTYESDPTYPVPNDNDQYQEPPFSGMQQQQRGPVDFQAPTY